MKRLVKIIEGPEYVCASEPAMRLSVLKHNDGGDTFIRLVDADEPNAVKVFAVRPEDIAKIAGDLIQL